MNIDVDNIYVKRKNIFDAIHNSNTLNKVLMAFFMACFTGLMAQIIIPLPWTPVPITAQTFAVLISGLVLGKRYGVLSQLLYIIIGALFVPWFGGMTGGFDILFGSNCGYFLGFILASYFIGAISEKYIGSRKFLSAVAVIGIANFILIYVPGLSGLALWNYLTQGTVISVYDLLMMGFVPFIIGDIVKILGAGAFSKVFLPKE